jgi:hypothetical protein
LIAACSIPAASVNSTPATGSPKAAASTANHASAAHIGSTLDLTGNSSGEKMAVTVIKVINRAHGTSFFTPDRGKRFYAAQFRLSNIGTKTYNDSPSNGAQVVDSAGQSYQSDLSDVHRCQSFPGSEIIAAGSTGLGCIVFQVPKRAHIVTIQFTLDSGFASDTGQWKV